MRWSRLADAAMVTAAVSLLITTAVAVATDSTKLWAAITMLGEEPAYMALSLAIYTLASPDLGAQLIAALALSGGLNIFLKNLLGLPRPPPTTWRYPASGPGFPSGHSQVSTSFWSYAALYTRSRGVAALALAVPLSVGLSRAALGVHYPWDVVGGWGIGLAVSALFYLFAKRGPSPRSYAVFAVATSLAMLAYSAAADAPTASKLGGVLLATALYPLLEKRGLVVRYASTGVLPRLLGFALSLGSAAVLTRLGDPLASALHTPLALYAVYAAGVAAALTLPLLIPLAPVRTR